MKSSKGKCGKPTANGSPCLNGTGCSIDHKPFMQAGTATSTLDVKAAAEAAAEPDYVGPEDFEYRDRIEDLEMSFDVARSIPDDVVPVEEKYHILSELSRGSIDEARPFMPDPDAFHHYNEKSNELVFDSEAYEAAAEAVLPSFQETRKRVCDTTREWLSERSDDELDRIAVHSGNPHFTTAPSDKKAILLDQTIDRRRKADYLKRSQQDWIAAGNHRYGPPGYTLNNDVQEAIGPHVDLDSDGKPRHFPPRFKNMPASDLRKAASALPESHLGDRRRGAPPLRRLAELADVHSDVRFSGEVIGPIHPKESVRVKAIHVPLAKADMPVFAQLAEGPGRKVTDEDGYRRILWTE